MFLDLSKMIRLKYPLILASGSPRRQELLKLAGFEFEVQARDIDERLDASPVAANEAESLALFKLGHYRDLTEENIVLCADTLVYVDSEVMGKPLDLADARAMLKKLSGRSHRVTTGVAIGSPEKDITFHRTTEVTFAPLDDRDIVYYLDTYHPIDKAGAYGIQEWLGVVAVPEIDGSFYNVVGLPVSDVYRHLQAFAI